MEENEDSSSSKGLQLPDDASPPLRKGVNYLFAIAINDYRHCTKLNNAVLDMEAFADLLASRYDFEPENIVRLANADATKRRVENEFIRLAKKLAPHDSLVIYFSGHGRYDEHLGGHWVPAEAGATDDDFPEYLSNDLVKGYLNRINSRHTFLIADSCFSGSLFIDKSKEKFTGSRSDSEPSRWGLTSGKKEIVSDGKPGEHSPFALALLDVLRKADQPPGVMRLCDLVLEKVAANARQTPMGSPLAVKGHQGGQFVFYFRADERQDWEAVCNSESTAALQAFTQRHPAGAHFADATRRIAWLQDRETLRHSATMNALAAFIARTPHPDLRREARERLKSMEDDDAWKTTLRRARLTDFLDYLDRFGEDGAHVDEARSRIEKIQSDEERQSQRQQEEAEKWEAQQRSRREAEERRQAQEAAAEAESRRQEQLAQKKREEEEQRKKQEEAQRHQPPAPKPRPPGSFPVRWIALGAAGLLALVLVVWQLAKPAVPGGTDKIEQPALTEEEAFRQAESGTITSCRNFLEKFSASSKKADVEARLKTLENQVAKLLNDADVLKDMDAQAACQRLKQALDIEPGNADALRQGKRLKCSF